MVIVNIFYMEDFYIIVFYCDSFGIDFLIK